MKKLVLVIGVIIFSIKGYSQVKFENGYFINNANQRTNCLIKNVDWKNNPTKFEYKLTENSKSQTTDIKYIREFGVSNLKYQRFLVKIDLSSNKLDDLNYVTNPKFTEETLFLKLLLEGNSSLYLYEDTNLRRYFYNVNELKITQLVYKKHLIAGNSKIGENKQYQQQLWNNLKCENITPENIKSVRYTEKDLVKFFTKQNNCNNSSVKVFEKKDKKGLFNLNIRLGVNFSSLSIDRAGNGNYRGDFDYKNQQGFRPGIEVEYILPFNKNKWALVFESSYQKFKGSYESTDFTESRYEFANVNYSTLDLLFGVRHYFFLNNKSKLFLTGSYVAGIPLGSSSLDYKGQHQVGRTIELNTRYNPSVGFGYNYHKLSFELKYDLSTTIIDKRYAWSSSYNSFSIILGYNLF